MQHRLYRTLYTSLLGLAGAVGAAWITSSLILRLRPTREFFAPEDVAVPGTRFLTVAGHQVAYREEGTGETTVLLIHGFGNDMQTWQLLQPLLAAEYRTIALDLWGFGASARPATLTLDDWLPQILSMMDALQISSAVLVAHSLGGRVALCCAAEHPERIRAIALIGGNGFPFAEIRPMLHLFARSPIPRLELRRLRDHPSALVRFIKRSFHPQINITEEMIRRFLRPLQVVGTEESWTHLGLTYPGIDIHALLPGVKCPALLIWGESDRVLPIRYGVAMAHTLPCAELVVIPNAAHIPQEEQPESVYYHLKEFLRQRER